MFGTVTTRIVILLSALAVVAAAYLALRWTDPAACPGLQALDPTCIQLSD
jgi:hypothetical protein